MGWPSVAWGLERISSRELAEWMAFARIEPIGDQRADVQAGIVASTIANAHRDPKQRRKAFSPDDFIPKYGQRKEPQDWRQQLHIVEMINTAMGGKDKRNVDAG